MIGWKPKFDDPLVASVRYRCLNPLRELQRRGFPVELFDADDPRRYSAVVFSKLYDEGSQGLAQELRGRGCAVIFDICDNHFYNPYDLPTFRRVRVQLLQMLALADQVVASTETLADVLMEEAGLFARPIVIGDAIEEDAVPTRHAEPRQDATSNLLWFGIHGGENAPYGMLDLLALRELLAETSVRRHPLRLTVLSNSRAKYLEHIRPFEVETRYLEWGTVELSEVLARSDVNLIPVSPNPFTRCKSNNRLALSLYAGLPTVADGIPSYRELASFCVLDDWEGGLTRYLDDPAAARLQATAARAYIREHYGIARIANGWAECLSRYA